MVNVDGDQYLFFTEDLGLEEVNIDGPVTATQLDNSDDDLDIGLEEMDLTPSKKSNNTFDVSDLTDDLLDNI